MDVAKERILEINPNAKVEVHRTFYMPDMEEEILDKSITYIIDGIDTVTAKIDLVVKANELRNSYNLMYGNGKQAKSNDDRSCRYIKNICMPTCKSYETRVKEKRDKQAKGYIYQRGA